jgi:squalene-hopene/tetraprenyl-beta-curcumene cyclase
LLGKTNDIYNFSRCMRLIFASCLVVAAVAPVAAQAPVTPKPPKASAEFVETPAQADEPLTEQFSLANAAKSLDAGAINFSQKHRSVQCHANLMYLAARPALEKVVPSPADMRAFHEWIVQTRWEKYGVIYDQWSKNQPAYQQKDAQLPATEPIVVAFGLAMSDRATTGKLHPATRMALDNVVARQRPDGGFNVVCDGLDSFLNEFDQTMLAAIAAGSAPDPYPKTEPARKLLAGVRRYVGDHPPQSAYHRGMLLWAAMYASDLATDEQRARSAEELRQLERADGGWCLADLLTDDEANRTGKFAASRPSDGYGTGFAVFALRNAGVPAHDPALKQGIAWLKTSQRASGRWFQPSFVGRPDNLISNSATAWAVLALSACGEAH